MSPRNSYFIERVIRAITRGAIPVDASQCDGACVVQAPADAIKAQRDGQTDRQAPIRWFGVR
jgi:hypothetical protein